MFFGWLKRSLPRGLYGRAALILLVPVIGVQLVVSVVFIQRHFEDVTRQMTGNLVYQVRYLIDAVDAAEDDADAQEVARRIGRALALTPDFEAAPAPRGEQRVWWDLSGRNVARVLTARVPQVEGVDLASDPRRVSLLIDTAHGPMRLHFARQRVSASNPHQLLVLMVATGLLMTLISIVFLRNQMRPIRRLARVAEAFGRGRSVPYHPAGALEVRSAGAAFLDMRARIERMIEQRTMMLSGVSHDLRTPLTRFRLGLSMLPEEDAAPLRRDVEEMERLLDAFLAFARSDALDEAAETDPAALAAERVARAAAGGGAVEMGAVEGEGKVRLRPEAMARALDNLIVNALRYAGRARVSVLFSPRALVFRVEDDGPGIPPAQRGEAVKPFVRLDAARNQDAGSGVGLGLAITQDIARRHGGTLRLGTSADLGGLQADIVLPR